MPTCKYNVVKNGKVVYSTFDMMEAHLYCADNGGTIEIIRIK